MNSDDDVSQKTTSTYGMTNTEKSNEADYRQGGVLECGVCRVGLQWIEKTETYRCPECGWSA